MQDFSPPFLLAKRSSWGKSQLAGEVLHLKEKKETMAKKGPGHN
jgi:hypothetical protein